MVDILTMQQTCKCMGLASLRWLFASVLLTVTRGNNFSGHNQERPRCQPGRLFWVHNKVALFWKTLQQRKNKENKEKWMAKDLFYSVCVCVCDTMLLFLLGFYCPLGSPAPVPCPKGTYGPHAGAVSMDSCLKCPAHHYCPRPGLYSPLSCGPVAQQPVPGQDTCICPEEGQSFQVLFTGLFCWSVFHMIEGSTWVFV